MRALRPCSPFVLLGALALAVPSSAQEAFATFPTLPLGVAPITVLDRQGHFTGRLLPQQRYWVPIERIPAFLQTALLAVEDANFYEHGSLDFRGIARALLKDAQKGRWAEGGSTITQQLIKNKFLSGEVSLDRKLKEARMAMAFEKTYSKRQILEMYFNEINYGNGAMGLAQASRLYFSKSPEQLNEAECLLLAGVPKNPSRYNPFGKTVDIAARRDVVLKRLVDLKIITPEQRQGFWNQPAAIQPPNRAPHYLAFLRSQLLARFGPEVLERGGLEIVAALDLGLQGQAEQALRSGVRRLAPDLQGALVCQDPATGDLLAAVGDADGATSINRAFTAKRQPGSAIKPLIYAAALEQGITAASRWDDTPVAYPKGDGKLWTPQNYGKEAFGELTLAQALAHSSNVVTVKLLNQVGVPSFVAFAARFGLPLQARNGLSLALGTEEVTLKDLIQAYTPLAGAGQRAEARSILRIHDLRQGTWTDTQPELSPVLSPEAAWITTTMLKEVLVSGTAKSLRPFSEAHPSAGKTGTTDAGQDAWFVGYSPHLLTGVWVGYDRPRPGGRGFTGGAVAAPIWAQFMSKALNSWPVDDFPRPETVVAASIDPGTGLLATEGCPEREDAWFCPGTEPTEPCPEHGGAPPAPAAPAEPI